MHKIIAWCVLLFSAAQATEQKAGACVAAFEYCDQSTNPADVLRLINAGAAIDSKCLAQAVQSNNQEVAQLLMSAHFINPKYNKIDLNAADSNGLPALFYAARHDHSPLTQLLLQQGADANFGWTLNLGIVPLHAAIQAKSPKCVQLLLAHGADKTHTHNGKDALQAAYEGGCKEIIKLLEDAR